MVADGYGADARGGAGVDQVAHAQGKESTDEGNDAVDGEEQPSEVAEGRVSDDVSHCAAEREAVGVESLVGGCCLLVSVVAIVHS